MLMANAHTLLVEQVVTSLWCHYRSPLPSHRYRVCSAVITCSHYMQSLHAVITCIHDMQSLHEVIACSHYMQSLHAVITCIHDMQSLNAVIACSHYMQSLHGGITCSHYMQSLPPSLQWAALVRASCVSVSCFSSVNKPVLWQWTICPVLHPAWLFFQSGSLSHIIFYKFCLPKSFFSSFHFPCFWD